MASFTPPPLPRVPPARGPVSARKVILALVLGGSIIFFFLILFAGVAAVLIESAPREGSHTAVFAAVKHVIKQVIVHVIPHFNHHK
jgi:hypothetical protein